MKAITLIQPWATLVAIGAKQIETRSWSTDYRGPLAIHAAKRFPKWAQELCYKEPFATLLFNVKTGYYHPWKLPRGVVIAVCTLVRCQRIKPQDVNDLAPEPERSFGDFTPGRFAWILRDVRPVIPPVPARGALGLWEWEQEGR